MTFAGGLLPFLVFLVAWVLGLICTFFPAVPATLLILIGAVVATLLDGYQPAQDLPVIITFSVVTALIMVVDNAAASWGSRKFGGSKQAMWGAVVGGIVGLFPLIPFGLILGPLLGAFLAELLLVRRPLDESLKSAWGTLVGMLSGMAAKFVLHLLIGAYGLYHFWQLS